MNSFFDYDEKFVTHALLTTELLQQRQMYQTLLDSLGTKIEDQSARFCVCTMLIETDKRLQKMLKMVKLVVSEGRPELKLDDSI